MNPPPRLLLLVPLALLGAALLLRSHLPLSAAAETEPYPTPSHLDNMVTVTIPTSKPRTTTPKRKPQPSVSADIWLRQQEAKTTHLMINRPYYADDNKKSLTGLGDAEAIEISNRTSIHTLLRTLHASVPFSTRAPFRILDRGYSARVVEMYFNNSPGMALYVKKSRYYLGRYVDAVALDSGSATQFLRKLREAVRKGRHKQRGYSVHGVGP